MSSKVGNLKAGATETKCTSIIFTQNITISSVLTRKLRAEVRAPAIAFNSVTGVDGLRPASLGLQ